MKRLKPAIFLSLCMSLSAYTPQAVAEDIAQVLERNKTVTTPEPPDIFPYIYTANFVLESSEGKESSNFEAQYKVNPNAAPGERVSVISASSEPYHRDFQTQIDSLDKEGFTAQDAANRLWCKDSVDSQNEDAPHLTALFDDNPPEIISEDDTQAVLAMPFKKYPGNAGFDFSFDDETSEEDKDQANKTVDKFLKKMKTQLVLDKPNGRMRKMRMWLPKPKRVMLIAKVKKMEFNIACEPTPQGHLYNANTSIEMQISALGKNNKTKQTTEIVSLETE